MQLLLLRAKKNTLKTDGREKAQFLQVTVIIFACAHHSETFIYSLFFISPPGTIFPLLKPLPTVLTSFVRGNIHISFPLFCIRSVKVVISIVVY